MGHFPALLRARALSPGLETAPEELASGQGPRAGAGGGERFAVKHSWRRRCPHPSPQG